MKVYTVTAGDTFERISKIAYGTPARVSLIKGANPHASGGLTVGMVLTLPVDPRLLSAAPRVVASRENEVSVRLNGKPFRFWTAMSIERSIDRFDQFNMQAPFDETKLELREAFRPLSFQRAEIFVGGELLYTGTNVNNTPRAAIDGIAVSVSGYALAGVLNDCPLPTSGSPAEYSFLSTLQDIATEQAAVFGLLPVFTQDAKDVDTSMNGVAIGVGERVLAFWAKLAQQLGIVIGNNAEGQPVFQREVSTPPIQTLEFGKHPVSRVVPELNPQQYYSHVTAVTPSFVGFTGPKHVEINPFLKGVTRPLTFSAGDVLPGKEIDAAKAKFGRMFANAIAYRVDVAGWRDVNGALWAPNTTVRLLAPKAMIYKATKFLIRSVSLLRDSEKDTASLLLVLPGAFFGRAPEVLPWLE